MRGIAVLLAAGLCACAQPMPIAHFAGSGPQLDPVRFFTGHVRSWGVIENRSGAPTSTLATQCDGTLEPDGSLHMVQRLTYGDGEVKMRDWHMRRIAPGRFEATANDMVGTGHGESAGRAFHLHWALAAQPGDPFANVWLSQWMYLMDSGTVVNRTIISKLGVIVAEATEGFERLP